MANEEHNFRWISDEEAAAAEPENGVFAVPPPRTEEEARKLGWTEAQFEEYFKMRPRSGR